MSQSPLVGAFVPAKKEEILALLMNAKSQSPLVGAFVPAGSGHIAIYVVAECRNPLWSGHSFRLTTKERLNGVLEYVSQSPLVGAFVPAESPSELLYRLEDVSQSPLVGAFVPAHKVYHQSLVERVLVAIPSGRGIRSGIIRGGGRPRPHQSQSPLVGAFVPAIESGSIVVDNEMSQSPLVGAFVPAQGEEDRNEPVQRSQSPLVGAFVPASGT